MLNKNITEHVNIDTHANIKRRGTAGLAGVLCVCTDVREAILSNNPLYQEARTFSLDAGTSARQTLPG